MAPYKAGRGRAKRAPKPRRTVAPDAVARRPPSLRLIITDYFDKPNKLSYGEGHDNSMCDKKALIAAKPLLLALKRLQPNCSFTPLSMQSACRIAAQEHKNAWKFSEMDIESFASKVSKQIRTMCRHLTQAIGPSKPPKWAQQFEVVTIDGAAAASATAEEKDEEQEVGADVDDEDAQEEEEEEEEEEPEDLDAEEQPEDLDAEEKPDEPKKEEPKKTEEPKKHEEQHQKKDPKKKGEQNKKKEPKKKEEEVVAYGVGWLPKQKLAWRLKDGDPKANREYTNDLIPPAAKAARRDAVVARWPDGFLHAIASLTKNRYTMMKDGVKVNRADLAAVGPYFVRTKKDRDPIMFLAHQDDKNKQICQVLIKYVIEEQHAIVLMTEVGEAMIKDPSGDPYEIRDAVLAKYRESHADAPKRTYSRTRTGAFCSAKSAAVAAVAPTGAADSSSALVPSTPPSKRRASAPSKLASMPLGEMTLAADDMKSMFD